MSVTRKVSTNPTGSKFIYLPKSWYNQHVQNGWDGKQVTITPSSKLLITPSSLPSSNFIHTKTPLRLPLAGGGSDIPEYYTKHLGGYWISGAINYYIHIILKRRFEPESKFVFSETQYVTDTTKFKHPILRAVCIKYNLSEHLELISIGDLPARTGLGSSASFTVGLLKAVHSYLNISSTPTQLAEEAYDIERNILSRKIGKQDQYIAVNGGINQYFINSQGEVTYQPLKIDYRSLEKWLLLFYVNKRNTHINEVLSAITDKDRQETEKLTLKTAISLQNSDFQSFGELIDQHWQIKRRTQPQKFDLLIQSAKSVGAIGGKLCGAGGGGCILLVCPPEHRNNVIETLQQNNTQHLPFNFEPFGSELY